MRAFASRRSRRSLTKPEPPASGSTGICFPILLNSTFAKIGFAKGVQACRPFGQTPRASRRSLAAPSSWLSRPWLPLDCERATQAKAAQDLGCPSSQEAGVCPRHPLRIAVQRRCRGVLFCHLEQLLPSLLHPKWAMVYSIVRGRGSRSHTAFFEVSGLPPNLTFYSLAFLNAGSCFGRIIATYIADRVGTLNVMAASCVGAAIMTFSM